MAGQAPDRPVPLPAPSRWRRVATSRGLWLLVGVALGAVVLVEGIEALGGAEGIRARYGAAAGWLLVPAQALVSVSPVPGELVAAVQVALYGIWPGAAFCWLGWMLAAFLEYALVERTARDLAGPDPLARLPHWLRRLPAHHPAFLILARFLPFGSHIVNATAGARRVPLARFAWTSAVALAPASLAFCAIARGLLTLG